MKKALITGGTGFVGGYLKADLEKAEYITEITSRRKNADCFQMKLNELGSIQTVLSEFKPDVIFHLAAQSSVADSWKEPEKTFQINVNGTINLLEVIRKLKLKTRILLIGSSEEYGKVTEENCPIPESHMPNPENIYAVTKHCQNKIGRLYAQNYDMDILMTRSFNHTGPGQSDRFVVSDFCRQAAEISLGMREPVIYVGNLTAKRDFTDVRDISKCYRLLAEKGIKGETYNVGSGKAISIESILEMIIDKSGKEIEVKTDEKKYRPADVPVHYADTKKIEKETGWRAEREIEETIEEMLEYWKTELRR